MNNSNQLKIFLLSALLLFVPFTFFSVWYNQQLIAELNTDLTPEIKTEALAPEKAEPQAFEDEEAIIQTDMMGNVVKVMKKIQEEKPAGEPKRIYMMPETNPIQMQ